MTEPIATIKQGQLKGVTDTDLNGDNFLKFLGIPYAKPPVGPLRFKAPQPAESWAGVRDATKEGSPCLARDFLKPEPVGSEDCLYLNVFTKELPKAGLSLKPVMFFIHGGGFTFGSGGEEMCGPKYLLTEDIVLVTINYRLGIFGFLSSDDTSLDIPGNAGLKDQTFALKWVQENIASFNGDPNNVTIFGISAGGASVHFQILSPTSKGLFHKAIPQSGTALSPWAWGQKNAIQVAELLGEKVSSDKEAMDVLIKTSSDNLIEASLKLPDVLLDVATRRPFGPVIEKPNPTAFLTENPTDLLAKGKFNQVPTIIGLTSNEGSLSELTLLGDNELLEDAGAFWSLALEKIIFADIGFAIGIIESTRLAAKTSQNPVFLYVLSYETAFSKATFDAMGVPNIDQFKGVPHGGDQALLLSNSLVIRAGKAYPELTEEALVPIRILTKIWADFARTGRPHPLWEPVTDVNELKYFDIDKNLELKVNPFEERVAFWKDIIREAGGIDAHNQETAIF